MAQIRNPIRFSDYFGIDETELEGQGVLNPTLNVDTRLFIDPLLLSESQHPEIAEGARKTYEKHFGRVIRFLRQTQHDGDVAWKSARALLAFPEIKWTCLGYGAASISGSGSGNRMTAQYMDTARQIVELGVEDPDLFAAMALFEAGVGPDRISDMTTNVIFGDLLRFNLRILEELGIPRTSFPLVLQNGNRFTADLPINPFTGQKDPVLLVPSDVLRDLPVATDWSEVADAASKNEALRQRVNVDIAQMWEVRSRKDKAKIRSWALSGRGAFEAYMDMIRGVPLTSYDLTADPKGEVFWRRLAARLAHDEPWVITAPERLNLEGVAGVVEQIINRFRFLIEDRRLSEELYCNGRPRPEKSAQRLFFAVADSYCGANNLDITPEADTGNGPVDFKFASGFCERVLVEIKLSRNSSLVKGYTKQLEAYKQAEETRMAYYVVIDVGGMGKKEERLEEVRRVAVRRGEQVSPIEIIDGLRRPSASRL